MSTTMVTFLRLLIEHNAHVSQVTTIEYKLSLKCDEFVKGHAFSHKIIRDCMLNALRTCQQSDLWTDRSDISLNVELFYIENRTDYSKEIDCYFEIVLTAYNNIQIKYNTDIPQVLQNIIKNLNNHNSQINQSFINMLRSKLKFNNNSDNNRRGIIVTGLKIINSQTQRKDGVSLRVSVKMIQPLQLELNAVNSMSNITPGGGNNINSSMNSINSMSNANININGNGNIVAVINDQEDNQQEEGGNGTGSYATQTHSEHEEGEHD